MGVYIRGMEMPTKCADCLFIDYFKGQWYCHSINDILETGTSKRDERCNLVPCPPHGDLIDRDPFIEFIKTHWDGYDQWFVGQLEARPTIIPAEEGE